MRITLLNPPWYVHDIVNGHQHGMRGGTRWPSLGAGGLPHLNAMKGNIYCCYPFHLGYTASLLRLHGHDVMFYDAIADCDDLQTFYRKIELFDPEVAVIETSSASYNYDVPIWETLADEGIKICLVGPHASTYADELVSRKYITWVATREYDDLVLEIADEKASEGVLRGPLPDNLDARPFPWLEYPTAEYYQDYFGFSQFQKPSFQLWSTRGCVYSCSYCLWRGTMYDQNGRGIYRQRSAENILAEVDDRFERLGMKHCLIDDDTFSIVGKEEKGSRGYDRVVGVCDGMRERGYEWTMMSRLDCHSLELFEYMRNSGCIGMKVGAESFSDKTLKDVTKHLKSAEMVERIKGLLDLGFATYLATTTYLPGESEEDRKQSGEILEELAQYKPGMLKWQRPHLSPLPGTKLFDKFKEQGYFDESNMNWDLFDGGSGKLHHIVEDYNQKHGIEGFESGRHEVEEMGHSQGQPGLKGKINR